jgi:hypothetical protein
MEEEKKSMPKKVRNSLLVLVCVLALLGIQGLAKATDNYSATASVDVGNIPPRASSASLNGETAITLVEGTTTPITGGIGAGQVVVSGTVTDDNSCKDLVDVKVYVYKGYANLASCTTTNYSTCYVLDDPSPSTDSSCTGVSDLEYNVNNTTLNNQLAMEYYALPAAGPGSNDLWYATIKPSDHAGLTASGNWSTSTGTVLNTLTALDAGTTITYGSVSNNSSSTGNHTALVSNMGNTLLDYNLSGANLTCASPGTGTIPVGNQQYALSSFTYESTPTQGQVALSGGATLLAADIAIATQSTVPSQKASYWQVFVPYNVVGTCSGAVTFAAIAH